MRPHTEFVNVKEISRGLISTSVDFALFSLFYGFEFGVGGYSQTHKAGERARRDMEEVNSKVLARAFYHLRKKGLVEFVKKQGLAGQITEAGKARLRSLVPVYDERRAWDGKIYLITYDIQEVNSSKRNALRNYLKKIGCGMLQQSVWLSAYNPKKLVSEFVSENGLEGELVIISSIGKDGQVGEMTMGELMERVYGLSEVNARYGGFLEKCIKSRVGRQELIISFLAILKDDPQIPFALLPDGWVGDKAYRYFKSLMRPHS